MKTLSLLGLLVICINFSNAQVIDTLSNQNSDEIMPSFPGGEVALFQFIHNNLNYPHAMLDSMIEGIVVVQFIIQTDGTLSDIKVVKDIGAGAADEAIRIVKIMPRWNPGINRGTYVPVIMRIPIHFKLPIEQKNQRKTGKKNQ